MMADSRWQDIYLFLKNQNYEVYAPGMKQGECYTKYIVIKDDGSSPMNGLSSTVTYYSIMCYVPKDDFEELEVFVGNVKESMKQIMPMIMPTGQESPSYYDDTYKAHMISIGYRNYKRNNLI
jgi:hypothetical protein